MALLACIMFRFDHITYNLNGAVTCNATSPCLAKDHYPLGSHILRVLHWVCHGSVQGADDDDSSCSGSDDDMDEDMADAAPSAVPIAAAQPPPAPVVDADGFELVQKRRGRR